MKPNERPGRSVSPAKTDPKPNRSSQPTQRSARQDRLAARQKRRDARNSGSSSSGLNPILIWTGVAVVAAIVVIAAAFVLTQTNSPSSGSYLTPTVTTPTNIASNRQTLGPANAPVTLDLYSDFRCTGCGQFARSQEPQLVSGFVEAGKLKIVYHDFLTIDSIDASQGITTTASRDAANAGLCAADEGKFWTYHDWLFANQSPTEDPSAFTIDRLIGIAKAAGVDNAGFESCVQQGTHNSEVAAEQSSAPSGISATPTVFVNGKVVNSSAGPGYQPTYAEIAAAINAALAAAPSPSSSPQSSANPSPGQSASPSAPASAAPSAS